MRVAVLGAGIQGACTALELALNSVEVDLYEKSDCPLARTSSHNEGKIHLGYVYANDRSLRTPRTMARGAVVFQRLMRRWLGHGIDAIPVSAPFYYVVHRDSLLSGAEIDAHLRAAQAIVIEESGDGPVDYFGSDYQAGGNSNAGLQGDASASLRSGMVSSCFDIALLSWSTVPFCFWIS